LKRLIKEDSSIFARLGFKEFRLARVKAITKENQKKRLVLMLLKSWLPIFLSSFLGIILQMLSKIYFQNQSDKMKRKRATQLLSILLDKKELKLLRSSYKI
jgi:hypothetical protein